MATSEVWAGKVDHMAHVVTDNAVRLGQIEFNSLAEAFIKTIRMYNKNAFKHLYGPQFIYRGYVYMCGYYGEPSKSGRGTTHYWTLTKTSGTKMPVTFGMYEKGVKTLEAFVYFIPKSKVNDRNWSKYISE